MEVNEINNEATQTLIFNMKKLINRDVYADVVFLVEGKKIFAHKAILQAQCDFFRSMFTNGMKETNQTEIEIFDWSHNSFLYMIEYLYTGQIDNFNKLVAIEVLGLADAFGIENLKVLSENTLIHNVDNENVSDYLC